MFQSLTTEQINGLLDSLPRDVSRLLGSREETKANAELASFSGLPEESLVLANDFYLSVVAKKVPASSLPSFLKDDLKVADQGLLRKILEHFAGRLYQYGDVFPDLVKMATEWGVNLPQGDPAITAIRKAVAEEEREERARETGSVFEGGAAPSSTRDRLPIVQALGKYPRLGEQMITGAKLQIKGSPEPARPNLGNWLKVYRTELGVGHHDPVLRAKFLFQSPTCKGLTSDERERLNLIFRSIEENAPLDIDTGRMEIIFPSFQVTERQAPIPPKPVAPMPTPVVSKASPAPANLPGTPPAAPKRQDTFSSAPTSKASSGGIGVLAIQGEPVEKGFRMGRGAHFTSLQSGSVPEKNEQAGNFSFSSSHTFPAEQETKDAFSIRKQASATLPSARPFMPAEKGPAPATPPKPETPRKLNPFQIHPVSLQGKEKKESSDASGRVVDLRDE